MEAEQQRLAAVETEEERKAKTETEAAAKSAALPLGRFRRQSKMVATGLNNAIGVVMVSSAEYCEQKCSVLAECSAFTFQKFQKFCSLYSWAASFAPNSNFDSGIRK